MVSIFAVRRARSFVVPPVLGALALITRPLEPAQKRA